MNLILERARLRFSGRGRESRDANQGRIHGDTFCTYRARSASAHQQHFQSQFRTATESEFHQPRHSKRELWLRSQKVNLFPMRRLG